VTANVDIEAEIPLAPLPSLDRYLLESVPRLDHLAAHGSPIEPGRPLQAGAADRSENGWASSARHGEELGSGRGSSETRRRAWCGSGGPGAAPPGGG
jgi:hypothetical protein